jgi:heme/copper-type cytochrome/quinol oxidase subunit 2
MRLIVLAIGSVLVGLVFLTTVFATARHRAQHRSDGAYQASAMAEYSWLVVPWLILIAAALPAVRGIVSAGH